MSSSRYLEISGVGSDDGVWRVASCRLGVDATRWRFGEAHAAAIDEHWQRRLAEQPQMFNGPIHLMHAGAYSGEAFNGTLLRSDFKSYLYWRENGFPAAGAIDAFGSALIRSCEGHVVLGRQRAGNVNAGVAYLPGGFIDHRDVAADGCVDIRASVLRELAEETGLGPADGQLAAGFVVTRWTALLSFAVELISPLSADALRARILAHIKDDPKSELTDAVIIRSPADIEAANVHPYARLLISRILVE